MHAFTLDKQDSGGNPAGYGKMFKGAFSQQKNIINTLNTKHKREYVFLKRTLGG